MICSVILCTTGFLTWESGRIVPNSRADIRSNLWSEIANVLSSLSSFVIRAQKEFSTVYQFLIQKLKAALLKLNSCLPQEAGWMPNIQLASFAWPRLFTLQAFAPSPSAAASVPLEPAAHRTCACGGSSDGSASDLALLQREIKYLRYGGEGRAVPRRGCGVQRLSCGVAACPSHP